MHARPSLVSFLMSNTAAAIEDRIDAEQKALRAPGACFTGSPTPFVTDLGT